MRSPEILLVQTERAAAERLPHLLRQRGFRVRAAHCDPDPSAALIAGPTDIVLFDVDRLGSAEIVQSRAVRARCDAPIVFVAGEAEEGDRVAALDMGADDILPRSLGDRELVARLRAILRRSGFAEAAHHGGDAVRFDGWRADLRLRRLTGPDGAAVALTAAEFDLLAGLIAQPRRTIARAELQARLSATAGNASERAVDVLVSRIRQKMARCGAASPIVTIRGVGYRLEADVDAGPVLADAA